MAAQPTEGAHLNTQTSLHNLATGQSLGRNSILEEKDDIESEIIAMTAPTGREIELESNPADFSRQNQASSPVSSNSIPPASSYTLQSTRLFKLLDHWALP